MSIRLILILLANIIRYLFNKLHYGKRYNSRLIERISPGASIRLFQKGAITIGYNVDLAPLTDIQVHSNGCLAIGDHVYMNRGCIISCHGKVTIGSGCMFGPEVKIFDNNHRFDKESGVSTKLKIGSISIGNNCWLASGVILLKGADIGDNCVIGAGCIINTKIPANSLVKAVQDLQISAIQ